MQYFEQKPLDYITKCTYEKYLYLCQQLSSIRGLQETATQFVYRAMSLRQKLIVLSKSPVAKIKYDQNLVQRVFIKSLEMGLTIETIMTDIKHLSRNPSVSNEGLIFTLG